MTAHKSVQPLSLFSERSHAQRLYRIWVTFQSEIKTKYQELDWGGEMPIKVDFFWSAGTILFLFWFEERQDW